jgi:hypothetical protein
MGAYLRRLNSGFVMRLSQRFESARRLSFLPAKPQKRKALDVRVRGFVSSKLSQSLILELACYKWL